MLQDVEHKAKKQLGNLFAKKTMAFLVMRNKSTQTCMVDMQIVLTFLNMNSG